MNPVETEAAEALANEYENVLADNGVQAESVEIDGVPVFGNLDFDPSNIDLVMGGTNENVTAAFYTLKKYFKNGLPKAFDSKATVRTANGKLVCYQVRQLQGDKDNRAQLIIGLALDSNRK